MNVDTILVVAALILAIAALLEKFETRALAAAVICLAVALLV